jgi:hypothetical protein
VEHALCVPYSKCYCLLIQYMRKHASEETQERLPELFVE